MNPKQFLITISFLSLSLVLLGQERQASTFVGVNSSTNYAYRSLEGGPSEQWILDLREFEKPIVGFDAGFTFFHQFKKGLRLETAMQYIRLGEKTKDYLFIFPDGTTSSKNKVVNNFDYIGVPLKLGYAIPINQRFSFFVQSGVSANVFFARRFKSILSLSTGETQESTSMYFTESDGFNRLNVMLTIGLGLDVKLTDSFLLRIEPNFKHAINPIVDAPIGQRPYTAGLNLGLFYQLGSR